MHIVQNLLRVLIATILAIGVSMPFLTGCSFHRLRTYFGFEVSVPIDPPTPPESQPPVQPAGDN